MKFLKHNWKILSLVFLTMLSEVFHLLFSDIPFNSKINWDAPVYYLTSQFGLLNFWPALVIFLMIPKRHKSTKCISFGLIVWNLKELTDEVCYMLHINTNVLEINKSFWGQIVFMIIVIGLSALGYARWKY